MRVTPFDHATAHYLTTNAAQTLLARAETLRTDGLDTLAALSRLRKDATPVQAAAAWEQVTLRQRAAAKFGADAQKMLLTREALEQASGRRASEYHAQCFAGFGHVSDLTGGIGADALALARAGLSVTLYERDPARARFAAFNMDALGLSASVSVVVGDVTEAALAPGAAWLDPARRTDGRRVGNAEDYSPPLSWARTLSARGVSFLGIKVSPAVPHRLAAEMGARLEFVSDAGECKEGLLWVTFPVGGVPQGGEDIRLTATRLTDAGPLHLTGTPDAVPLPIGDGPILYEPDPAVIRAHLVGTLAAHLNAACVDPQIAYLLAQEYVPTPFASAYQMVERFAWGRRRLQDALTRHGAGRLVVKKRGFALEPDDVRRGLKLTGTQEWTVVISRAGRGHDAFLCQPMG